MHDDIFLIHYINYFMGQRKYGLKFSWRSQILNLFFFFFIMDFSPQIVDLFFYFFNVRSQQLEVPKLIFL